MDYALWSVRTWLKTPNRTARVLIVLLAHRGSARLKAIVFADGGLVLLCLYVMGAPICLPDP